MLNILQMPGFLQRDVTGESGKGKYSYWNAVAAAFQLRPYWSCVYNSHLQIDRYDVFTMSELAIHFQNQYPILNYMRFDNLSVHAVVTLSARNYESYS